MLVKVLSVEAAYRSQNYEQLIEYKDKYVISGTLWNQSVNTIYSCAISCQNDIKCMSFFYGENVCSGYNLLVPSSPEIKAAGGLEFYRRTVECDGDYALNLDTMVCYKVVNETRTWTNAKQICEDEGAHLAIIDTGEKLNGYQNLPSSACTGTFVPFHNKCYWVTNISGNWYSGETTCLGDDAKPASFPDASAYILVVNGAGINGSTEDVWIGVNDFDGETVWKNYDGSDLNMLDFIFDYATEGSENGKDALAIVPTENCIWRERREVTDLLKMLCEKNIIDEYWIGGSDIDTEDVWKWETGEGMNYSYFVSGKPVSNTLNNCAALSFSSIGLHFRDEDCFDTKKFICVKT